MYKKVGGMLLLVMVISLAAATSNSIEFTEPTPENNTYLSEGILELNLTVDIENLQNVTYYLYDDSDLRNETFINESSDDFYVNYTGLEDGIYYYNATARNDTDKYIAETRNITIDTVPPEIGFVEPTPLNGSSIYDDWFVLNVSVSDENLANVSYGLFNGSGLVENVSFDSFESYNFTDLSDGVYYFNATAVDEAGNVNTTETREVSVDELNVSVNFSDPTPNKGYFSSYNWFEANVSVASFDNLTYSLYNDSTELVDNETFDSFKSYNFSELDDGLYYYNVSLEYEGFTNITETRNITIDTVPPEIGFVEPSPDSGRYSAEEYLYLNATVDDINFKNLTYKIYNSTSLMEIETLDEVKGYNFTNLSDGVYYFNASAVDEAGNINSTETRNITIDTTLPGIKLETPINNSYQTENNTFVNATVDDINFKNLTYNLHNSSKDLIKNKTLSNMAGYNFSNLSKDRYYFNATTFDKAGNYNSTETWTFEIVEPVGFNKSSNISDIELGENEVYNLNLSEHFYNGVKEKWGFNLSSTNINFIEENFVADIYSDNELEEEVYITLNDTLTTAKSNNFTITITEEDEDDDGNGNGGSTGGGGGSIGLPPTNDFTNTLSYETSPEDFISIEIEYSEETTGDLEFEEIELPEFPRLGYRSFSINADPNPERAVIDFSVSNEWFEENDLEATDVALFRENAEWEEVSTVVVGEENDRQRYRSTLQGFSSFIIGEREEVGEDVDEDERVEETDDEEDSGDVEEVDEEVDEDVDEDVDEETTGYEIGWTTYMVSFAMGIFIVLAIFLTIMKKPKPRPYPKYNSEESEETTRGVIDRNEDKESYKNLLSVLDDKVDRINGYLKYQDIEKAESELLRLKHFRNNIPENYKYIRRIADSKIEMVDERVRIVKDIKRRNQEL